MPNAPFIYLTYVYLYSEVILSGINSRILTRIDSLFWRGVYVLMFLHITAIRMRMIFALTRCQGHFVICGASWYAALYDPRWINHTGKTAAIRRIAVPETRVNRYHGSTIEGTPWKPSYHHSTIVSSGVRAVLNWSPIMPRVLTDWEFFSKSY